jgi:acetylornithine deacetylase/succinyl-diaminopimelate desuccinylase-like protein
MASPLADAIGDWLAEADPGVDLAPMVMPGFSDSNAFRAAFPDAVVYGFCPARELDLIEAAPLIHGADERVPASDVELAAGFFYELPRRMLG